MKGLWFLYFYSNSFVLFYQTVFSYSFRSFFAYHLMQFPSNSTRSESVVPKVYPDHFTFFTNASYSRNPVAHGRCYQQTPYLQPHDTS